MSDAELLREWYTETPEDKIHPWEDLNEADFYFVRAKAVNNALDQLATLTQERDALREVVGILTNAGESLRFYYASHGYGCNCVPCMRVDKWEQAIKRAMQLLTPSGEAGKGGGVCG